MLNNCVICDFDGVIIKSSHIQKWALQESYRLVVGRGSPSVDEFFSHSGDSLENIFAKMGFPSEMVEIYRRISWERMGEIIVYDGMRELLAKLNAVGYRCALCTGKERRRTMEMLRKFSLDQYFDAVVCSDDVEHPKPAPDSLLLAMTRIGARIEDSVMVGDARNDILCARNAGMTIIAVTWGDAPREVIEQSLPDYIVDNVDQLWVTITSHPVPIKASVRTAS